MAFVRSHRPISHRVFTAAASVKIHRPMRGPQNQWTVCSTCRCTAIILIFPLFVFYGFFSSVPCHHHVRKNPGEWNARIFVWSRTTVRAFLRKYNNSQKNSEERKRKILYIRFLKFHLFVTTKKNFIVPFLFGISLAGSMTLFALRR